MLTSLAFAAAALAQLTALPDVYHGRWSVDQAGCVGEDTRGVDIQPTSIVFYEARGLVRSASQGAKGASARVDFTGEGRTWSEAVRLRPLPGDRLELTALGRPQIFERCRARVPGQG